MAKRKLTLTVDEDVVARAHAYSEARRTSISQLVTDYLGALARTGENDEDVYTPAVRRLLGILPATVTVDVYHQHLADKYGPRSGGASA